jgi:hypothetical protein
MKGPAIRRHNLRAGSNRVNGWAEKSRKNFRAIAHQEILPPANERREVLPPAFA